MLDLALIMGMWETLSLVKWSKVPKFHHYGSVGSEQATFSEQNFMLHTSFRGALRSQCRSKGPDPNLLTVGMGASRGEAPVRASKLELYL